MLWTNMWKGWKRGALRSTKTTRRLTSFSLGGSLCSVRYKTGTSTVNSVQSTIFCIPMKLVLLLQLLGAVVNGRSITSDDVSTVAAVQPAETRVHDHRYRFRYKVAEEATGDFQSRTESRNAEGIVTGSYRFLQPNGCVRVVKYTADEFGFHPVVTYEGDCEHHTAILPTSSSSSTKETSTKTVPSTASSTEDKTIGINPLSRPVQSVITPSFTPETAAETFNSPLFRPTLPLGTGQPSSESLTDNEPASERFSPVLFQQIQNLTNLPIVLLGNLAQQIGQIGKPTTTTTTTTSAPATAPILVETNDNVVKDNSNFSSNNNNVESLSLASSPNPRDASAIPDSILTLLESFPSSESSKMGRLSSAPTADVTSEDDPVKASASEVISDISKDLNVAVEHSSELITSESEPTVLDTVNVKDKTVTPHFFGAAFVLPEFPTLPSPVQLLETLIPGISSVAKPAVGNAVPLLSSTATPDQGMESASAISPAETLSKTTETSESLLSSSSAATQGPSTNVVAQVFNPSTSASSFPSITASSETLTTVPLTIVSGSSPMLENLVSEPELQNSSPTGSSSTTVNTPLKIDHENVMTPVDVDDSHTMTTADSGVAQESHLQTSITTEEGTGKTVDEHTSHTLNTFDVTSPEKDIDLHPTHTGHTSEEQPSSTLESEMELSDVDPAPNAAIPQRPDSVAIEIADPASRGTEPVVGTMTSTGDHTTSLISTSADHSMIISEGTQAIAKEQEMETLPSPFSDGSRTEFATIRETNTHSSLSSFPTSGFIVSQPEMRIQLSQQQQQTSDTVAPSSLFEDSIEPRDAFTMPESSQQSLSSINPMPGTIIISQPVETGPFIVRKPKTMMGQRKVASSNQLQQQQHQVVPSRASAVPARLLSMPYGMRVHHQAYVPAYQFGTTSGSASSAPSFDYRQTNPAASYMTHRMHSAPTAMSNSNNNNQPHHNSYTVQPPSQAHPTWSPYYSAYVYQ